MPDMIPLPTILLSARCLMFTQQHYIIPINILFHAFAQWRALTAYIICFKIRCITVKSEHESKTDDILLALPNLSHTFQR